MSVSVAAASACEAFQAQGSRELGTDSRCRGRPTAGESLSKIIRVPISQSMRPIRSSSVSLGLRVVWSPKYGIVRSANSSPL